MIDSVGGASGLFEAGRANTKLRSAVRDFEAMLIADLLKMADQEKPSTEPGMDGYDDMRTQSIAQAMAGQGGIGIGKLLLKQLDRDGSRGRLKSSQILPIP